MTRPAPICTQRIPFLSCWHNETKLFVHMAIICNLEVRPLVADSNRRYLRKRRAILEQIRNVCNYGVENCSMRGQISDQLLVTEWLEKLQTFIVVIST